MSDELRALEESASALYRGIARLRTQQGLDREKKLAKLNDRVDAVEDKIAALGLAESRYSTEDDPQDIVRKAVEEERTIEFQYTDANGFTTQRVVSPYDANDKSGYMLGFDHHRDAIRRFDSSRMLVLGVGTEDYVAPA